MIVDGKLIARDILEDVKKDIQNNKLQLTLSAVLVGDDPEFRKFVELKGKKAGEAGIGFKIHQFSESITTEELKKEITIISAKCDGVLVELPLPEHIDEQAVLNEIPVEKDVDVLSNKAQSLFYANGSKINPPSVEAVKNVFEKNNIEVKDKKVAVFGYGSLVGKPIAHWLKENRADISVIRSRTENPSEISIKSDIIISGVGKPGLIIGDMVKEGVVVVDFGYGKNNEGKMSGDVDFNSVMPKTSFITPVPGGMGPILIATVLKNLILLNDK